MARPHIAHSTPNNQEETRSDGFGLSQHCSQPSECDYGGALPAASIRAGIPFHFRTYCSTAAACSARMEEPVMCRPCHRPQRRLGGLHRAACTAADLQRPHASLLLTGRQRCPYPSQSTIGSPRLRASCRACRAGLSSHRCTSCRTARTPCHSHCYIHCGQSRGVRWYHSVKSAPARWSELSHSRALNEQTVRKTGACRSSEKY